MALTPKSKVSSPPKKAPDTNEIIITKKRMARMPDSRSFRVTVIYAARKAERRFPVDMVVQYGESTSFLNEDI